MKYICTICGYIYDDEKEKIKFNELPEDWTCPLCGSPKSAFELINEETELEENDYEKDSIIKVRNEEIDEDMKKLSYGQLSTLFSNLARGCEKQYKYEEEKSFEQLSEYFRKITPKEENASVENLLDITKFDINNIYLNTNKILEEKQDRGAKRANTWGEKVTRMISSLLNMYNLKGEEMFKDKEIWICTVCGFIYVGDNPPERCPVCKVAKSKLKKVEGRI